MEACACGESIVEAPGAAVEHSPGKESDKVLDAALGEAVWLPGLLGAVEDLSIEGWARSSISTTHTGLRTTRTSEMGPRKTSERRQVGGGKRAHARGQEKRPVRKRETRPSPLANVYSGVDRMCVVVCPRRERPCYKWFQVLARTR